MYRQAAADYGYPPSGGSQFGQHPTGQGGGGVGIGRQWAQQGQMQQQAHQQQQGQWGGQQQHAQQQGQGQGQQGQQQQQQGNGASATDAQSQAASGGAGQEMNLASVLHYLQSEWRRWERDRNEWEIERAEMRARIALLEGQRRSAENLKVDLLRRVKMLEFALRQERTKAANSGKQSTLAPSRLAILQDEEKGKDQDTASEGSDESVQDRKPNGAQAGTAAAMSRISSLTSRSVAGPAGPVGESAWKSVGAVPPKDPKARARSREYLKQCLQEITYLTSPGALNPLPARAPITIERPSSPAVSVASGTGAGAGGAAGSGAGAGVASTGAGAAGAATGQAAAAPSVSELPDRPRKALPTRPIPANVAGEGAKEGEETAEQEGKKEKEKDDSPAPAPAASQNAAPAPAKGKRESNIHADSRANGSPLKKSTLQPQVETATEHGNGPSGLTSPGPSPVDTLRNAARQPPSSPARRTMNLPLDDEEATTTTTVAPDQTLKAEGKDKGYAESTPLSAGIESQPGTGKAETASDAATIHATGADISSDASTNSSKSGIPDAEPDAAGHGDSPADASADADQSQLLTAIYRPESKAAWRDQLRAANEQADKARDRSSSVSSSASSASTAASTDTAATSAVGTDEDQLHSISLSSTDLDDAAAVDKKDSPGADEEKNWSSRKVLKSHLDIVRSVAFAGTASGAGGAAGAAWGKSGGYAGNVVLISGGDDCTVKVWSVAASTLRTPKPNSIEVEPITTYRGHTMPITTVLACSPLDQLFSASLDSTIRVWSLPPASADPYAPYDASRAIQLLEGHTDAVWDLVMLPPSPAGSGASSGSTNSAGNKGKARLISIGADKTLKVWERELGAHSSAESEGKVKGKAQAQQQAAGAEGQKGKASVPRWTLCTSHKLEATPTCMSEFGLEQGKVVIGFSDGRVGVMSVEEGETRWYGEKSENLVNAVLCHPTWPVILAGYEDGVVRIWDARQSSRSPKHSIKAHPSAITGLTIPATAPDTLLTSATDCLVRVWDLNKRTAVQDCQGHRQKAGEGVVGVASHGELPFVASAGADGTVRLWSDI